MSGLADLALSGPIRAELLAALEEMSWEARLVAGRYEDLGEGHGLRLAWDSRLNRLVELEVRPAGEGLLEAAKKTAQSRHPGIPALHDLGELEGGDEFVVRAHTPGTLLGELGLSALMDRLLGVAEAFAFAHSQGSVHGCFAHGCVQIVGARNVVVRGWRERGTREADEAALCQWMLARLRPFEGLISLRAVVACLASGADAAACCEALRAWSSERMREEHAERLVSEASGLLDAEQEQLAETDEAIARCQAALSELSGSAPEQSKAPHWKALSEQQARARSAQKLGFEAYRLLEAALVLHEASPGANRLLAERRWKEHRRSTHEELSRHLAEQLGRHAEHLDERVAEPIWEYLSGKGQLTVVSKEGGTLFRYHDYYGRLAERQVGTLAAGTQRLELPAGSYVVRYGPHRAPIAIEAAAQSHLRLSSPGPLSEDEIWVPPGPFLYGPEAKVLDCPGFVMSRFPVTNREFMEFLTDLASQGRMEEALAAAPRTPGHNEQRGTAIAAYDGRRFHLIPDEDGDLWPEDWPILRMDWFGARAYLAWKAQKTGKPWRLPSEVEWEKAARGVDGRRYPWGNAYETCWTATRGSQRGGPAPVPVDSAPIDCSPFGVRGLGGNAGDWCLELYDEGPVWEEGELVREPQDVHSDVFRVVRGGAWSGRERSALSHRRNRSLASNRYTSRTVRGVYSAEGCG